MPDRTPHQELVLRTFVKRALRTALLIDDQFPTYVDLLEGRQDEFTDADRAARLYGQFKRMHLPCDVVNRIPLGSELSETAERIRKSDLIVLDYHLTPRSEDSTQSTELLAQLADTPHFNTVVLYTQERDLRKVWRDIACRLRGGWSEPVDHLAGMEVALEEWERLQDRDDLPEPPIEYVECLAIVDAETRRKGGAALAGFLGELRAHGVPAKQAPSIAEALVHRTMIRRFEGRAGGERRHVYGRYGTNPDVIWLQCANCFVAIARKSMPAEGAKGAADAPRIEMLQAALPEPGGRADAEPEAPNESVGDELASAPMGLPAEAPDADASEGTDPEGILDCLEAALLDWHPSFVQIVLSEVQNLLELEALATQDAKLRDPDTQVGLSYYVLTQLRNVEESWSSADLTSTVRNVVDRIVEGIRRRISSDIELEGTVAELLAHELDASGWPTAPTDRTGDAMWKAAAQLGRYPTAPNSRRCLLRLNAFLATEPFRRLHVSTGTVFRQQGVEDLWVCVSPACDMVPRDPGSDPWWLWELHPMRPMVALRLYRDPPDKGLKEAERGWHVFLDLEGEEPQAYKVLSGTSAVPAYEMLFPTDTGRVVRGMDAAGVARSEPTFEAYSLRSGRSTTAAGTFPPVFAAHTYQVVAQLRPAYANRVLQLVGQHLSRIGVDFVSSGKEPDT